MILKPPSGDVANWKTPDPEKRLRNERRPGSSARSPLGKEISDRSAAIGINTGIRPDNETIKQGRTINHKGQFFSEDPAIMAMRAAGLQTTGRELTPVKDYAKKDPSELEERPSEVAKRTFEDHGLNFVYVATKIHEIMDGSEPKVQLAALEMVNKVLLKSEEENEEMKKLLEQARTPSVVINIASPFSSQEKSHLDILIPS